MPRKTKTKSKSKSAPRSGKGSAPDLAHIAEALRPLAIAMDELTPDPHNARTHSARNLEAIERSLKAFGQRKPILVRRAGMIITAGNGTFDAAKALGWTHLAAVVVDDDETTAKAYAIADNRTAELAEWDYEELERQLEELGDDLALDAGFDESEFETMAAEVEQEFAAADAERPQRPAPAESAKPVKAKPINPTFAIVVHCKDESAQRAMFDRLSNEGHECKLLTV